MAGKWRWMDRGSQSAEDVGARWAKLRGCSFAVDDLPAGLQLGQRWISFFENTNPGTGNGLWHLSTGRQLDGQPNHSPAGSIYFGRGEGPMGGGNFNTGAADFGASNLIIHLVCPRPKSFS